jgi:hypothetical protein
MPTIQILLSKYDQSADRNEQEGRHDRSNQEKTKTLQTTLEMPGWINRDLI